MKNLDLENNEVTKEKGYTEFVWKLIPTLEVLDNCDKEGEEVFSDDDDYGEEGEGDMEEPTPSELAYMKERGISPEEFANMDFGGFEGGEDDMEDFEDESESEEPAGKATKRQKH